MSQAGNMILRQLSEITKEVETVTDVKSVYRAGYEAGARAQANIEAQAKTGTQLSSRDLDRILLAVISAKTGPSADAYDWEALKNKVVMAWSDALMRENKTDGGF